MSSKGAKQSCELFDNYQCNYNYLKHKPLCTHKYSFLNTASSVCRPRRTRSPITRVWEDLPTRSVNRGLSWQSQKDPAMARSRQQMAHSDYARETNCQKPGNEYSFQRLRSSVERSNGWLRYCCGVLTFTLLSWWISEVQQTWYLRQNPRHLFKRFTSTKDSFEWINGLNLTLDHFWGLKTSDQLRIFSKLSL